MPITLRPITLQDAKGALQVYAPYVTKTAITFEYEVPTVEDFATRIKTITAEYPWLVLLDGDKLVGYVYALRHRYRTAYQWSPECSIYLAEEVHGKGIARILYETLFAILRLQGYVNVFAGVGMPNEKSEGFHRALGFEMIGDFKKIGYKLGEWHDVRWFQLQLSEHIEEPPAPKTIQEVEGTEEFSALFREANWRLRIA